MIKILIKILHFFFYLFIYSLFMIINVYKANMFECGIKYYKR